MTIIKKRANKGFSLVELLAVIAILGILSGLGIIAYNRYVSYARKKAYETLRDSSIQATKQYFMDHSSKTEASLDDLLKENYIENIQDPISKDKNCKGKIKKNYISKDEKSNYSASTLKSDDYIINVCCENYNYTYYSSNDKYMIDDYCRLDLDKIGKIYVLNVYPSSKATNFNRLEPWLENYKTYKENEIIIKSIDTSTFTGSELDNYDVVVFGFADCNHAKDIKKEAAERLKTYIENGGAVIFGHDTLIDSNNVACGGHPNFNSLAEYADVKLGVPSGAGTGSRSESKIKKVEDGILFDYPYSLGDNKSLLTVPVTHVSNFKSNGKVWMVITDNMNSKSDNKDYAYLSTSKKYLCAYIQTGHSFIKNPDGTTTDKTTDEEKKIIANLIYYMRIKQYEKEQN